MNPREGITRAIFEAIVVGIILIFIYLIISGKWQSQLSMKRKKKIKAKLIGRDPTFGFTTFKTGAILTPKDKLRNRNTKLAKRKVKKDLSSE